MVGKDKLAVEIGKEIATRPAEGAAIVQILIGNAGQRIVEEIALRIGPELRQRDNIEVVVELTVIRHPSLQERSVVERLDRLELAMVAIGMPCVRPRPHSIPLVREAAIHGDTAWEIAGVDPQRGTIIVETADAPFRRDGEITGRLLGAEIDEPAERKA
ncbi:hypothetical protein D9M73_133930 [compost metagenome]